MPPVSPDSSHVATTVLDMSSHRSAHPALVLMSSRRRTARVIGSFRSFDVGSIVTISWSYGFIVISLKPGGVRIIAWITKLNLRLHASVASVRETKCQKFLDCYIVGMLLYSALSCSISLVASSLIASCLIASCLITACPAITFLPSSSHFTSCYVPHVSFLSCSASS